MCDLKVGDKIYKKQGKQDNNDKPIKYTILKIEEIILGDWIKGFTTKHIAILDDDTNYTLCYKTDKEEHSFVLKLVS